MSYRTKFLAWQAAAALVEKKTGESGLLIAAFRTGQFFVRADATGDAELSFAEVQDIFGPPVSGVIHNLHPLTDHRPDDQELDQWLQSNSARVKRLDIIRLWPEVSSSPADDASRSAEVTPRRAGGRPMKHDWARAAAFATAYIVEHDCRVQAELTDAIAKWFEATDGASPDERAIQRFVSDVFSALK